MKRFFTLFLFVILAYLAGVGIDYYLSKPEDISASFTSTIALFALVAAFIAFVLYISSKPIKEKPKDVGVGKTKSGEKLSQFFDAKWITEKELETNPKYMFSTYDDLPKVKKSGIVIRNEVKKGKLEVNMYDPIHTLIIGTTGSGKSANIINPAVRILSHTAEKPCLVMTFP